MYKIMGIALLLVVLVVIRKSPAGQIATTSDGKTVILEDNGQWHFASEKEKTHISREKPKEKRYTLIDIVRHDQSFDFRNARWGMSPQDVIISEKAELVKAEKNKLEYKEVLLGYNCTVFYYFINQKLTHAEYIIHQPHVDPGQYIKGYEELKKYLIPLYGIAISENFDWKNDMYRGERSKWGFAISIGFLTCRTVWRNTTTQITLTITGGNHEISTDIEYTSLKK